MVKIYHNNRCAKSRETLEIVKEKTDEVEIVEYLKTPPDQRELKALISKLEIKPVELIRKNEKLFKEKYAGHTFSDDQWIKILSENPVLIERPIVVNGDKAIIGRPPEKVLSLF